MIRVVIIALGLLVASLSWASPTVSDLERRIDLLRAHRSRLTQRLEDQSQRIHRLKDQPPGVSRDYQLKAALRTSQQLAQKLTRLRQDLRTLTTQTIALYDQLIASANTSPELRAQLEKSRKQLLAAREASDSARIVTNSNVSPYDSPDDLEEKADLLEDSEEKVRKQLRRIKHQLARVRHRLRLERHDRAADDSPFVESAPRRISRPRDLSGGGVPGDHDARMGKANTAQDSSPDRTSEAAPAPNSAFAGPLDGLAGDDSAGTHTPDTPGGGSVSVTIRDVLDPDLSRQLQAGAGNGGSLESRYSALQTAARKLERLARGLSVKSKALRHRARTLRKQK